MLTRCPVKFVPKFQRRYNVKPLAPCTPDPIKTGENKYICQTALTQVQ